MKPYRLINSIELEKLQQHFKQMLHEWNEGYALYPLTVQQTMAPKNYRATDALMLTQQGQEIALIEGDYLSVLNQCLFGCENQVFNTTSQDLFRQLLDSLLLSERCQFEERSNDSPDWFYAGSTSLLLTISCEENNFSLIINPDWVYQQLPQLTSGSTSLHCIQEAVAEQQITLTLQLTPSMLSVKSLTHLQVGDVLTTNHPLSNPVNLLQGKKLFAHAELRQKEQHKSIVLKRLS